MDRLVCNRSPRGDRPRAEDASGSLSACGTWGRGKADQFSSNPKVDKDGWCGRPGVTRFASNYSFFKDDPIQMANMRGICSTSTSSGGSLISSGSVDRASGFGIDLSGSQARPQERSAGALQLAEMYKEFSKAPPPIHPRIKEKVDKMLYTSSRSNHSAHDDNGEPPRMPPHIQEKHDEMPINRIGQGCVGGIWADASPPAQTAPTFFEVSEFSGGHAAYLVCVQDVEASPLAPSYGSAPGADLQATTAAAHAGLGISETQVQEASEEDEPVHPLIKQKVQMMSQFQEQ